MEIESGDPSSSMQEDDDNNVSITIPDQTSPSLHLLSERGKYRKLCLDLYKASERGDVVKVRHLIEEYPGSLSAAITEDHRTVLHVAAGAKQTRFVKEMMNVTNNSINLRLEDRKNFTAFCYAVMAGSIKIAQIMLAKDSSLLTIRVGNEKMNPMTPLFLAVSFGQREMSLFLYDQMKRNAQGQLEIDKKAIFYGSINNTMYDLALKLLKDDKTNQLAVENYGELTPLHRLAQTPLHLLKQSSESDKTALLKQALDSVRKGDITASLKQLAFYLVCKSDQTALLKEALELVQVLGENILKKGDRIVIEYFQENKKLLFDAARLGNYKFLAKLIGSYPDLVLELDHNGRSIFHIAVTHRDRNLFSLIYEIGINKQFIIANTLDDDGNSILHLAAKYREKRRVPDAVSEMQREFEIYKEVEQLVVPSYKDLKNIEGETPREIFTRDHAPLLERGEDHLWKIAETCMIVATLVITTVFAAAFSIPGGNDQVKGIPIHLKKVLFGIFSIVDAIALSASMITILTCWSIFVSPYEEQDFLKKLPSKLGLILLTLFISIASMMVAFASTFFLAYTHSKLIPIPILISTFVSLPVIIFVLLQRRLLKVLFRCSFRSRFSSKHQKTIEKLE